MLLIPDWTPYRRPVLLASSPLLAHLQDLAGEMIHGHGSTRWAPLIAWAPVGASVQCTKEVQAAVAPLRALTASLGVACAILDPCALVAWSTTPSKGSSELLAELLVSSNDFKEWLRGAS